MKYKQFLYFIIFDWKNGKENKKKREKTIKEN